MTTVRCLVAGTIAYFAALSAVFADTTETRNPSATISMNEAVAIALRQNHAAIAARLQIDESQLDVVAARLYPNPIFSWNVNNLVLGKGNSQNQTVHPGFFDQPVQTLGLSEILDVWSKRGARIAAAERGVEQKHWEVEDALREIAWTVRSAWATVLREQTERELAAEMAARYRDTIRLSQSRFSAGDISETELRKTELEGLRYENAVVEAENELAVARERLAGLMALKTVDQLPAVGDPNPPLRAHWSFDETLKKALESRPDLRAAASARVHGEAALTSARREAFPDLNLEASYTHDNFTVSGDNANTLGLGVGIPLPLFDRNQANVGRARLEIRRADNERSRISFEIREQVSVALSHAERSQKLLDTFEGGMIERAEQLLRVAERSYRAGAISLLELLEAQRTYLDTRGQMLRARYDFRQALIDVIYATGGTSP